MHDTEKPGRNDCLSERSERVSFRQRRAGKSQAGVTVAAPFLLCFVSSFGGEGRNEVTMELMLLKREQSYMRNTLSS